MEHVCPFQILNYKSSTILLWEKTQTLKYVKSKKKI